MAEENREPAICCQTNRRPARNSPRAAPAAPGNTDTPSLTPSPLTPHPLTPSPPQPSRLTSRRYIISRRSEY